MSAIERITSPDLVAFLLENIPGALFILDREGAIVVANKPGRALLRRGGKELVKAIRRSESAIVDTDVGPLRVVRRAVPNSEEMQYLVLLAEPFSVDAREIYRLAVTRWKPTQRQAEVLRYVLEGLANKEIAEQVGVSPRTVEVHMTALLEKAAVESRARLIAKARELATLEHVRNS